MRGTIHQAYFLPWLGYYAKLAHSDVFVVLDDVQFRKRHYFDRTKFINMHGKVAWLSLPVGECFKRICSDVHVHENANRYWTAMVRTVRESYAKARHYEEEWPDLERLLAASLSSKRNLVEINLLLIRGILDLLRIEAPKIVLSSALQVHPQDASSRIVDICGRVGISTLIVGSGKSLAVHDWKVITDAGILVEKQDYLEHHPAYSQSRHRRSGFERGLSAIDAILNVGREETRRFIMDGVHKPERVLTCSIK